MYGDNDETCTLAPEQLDILERAFDEARRTPGHADGRVCPFCGFAAASVTHENGVRSCTGCDAVWADDAILERLIETDDERDARLALAYQTAHSTTLWGG